jgi:hypothetical protein
LGLLLQVPKIITIFAVGKHSFAFGVVSLLTIIPQSLLGLVATIWPTLAFLAIEDREKREHAINEIE